MLCLFSPLLYLRVGALQARRSTRKILKEQYSSAEEPAFHSPISSYRNYQSSHCLFHPSNTPSCYDSPLPTRWLLTSSSSPSPFSPKSALSNQPSRSKSGSHLLPYRRRDPQPRGPPVKLTSANLLLRKPDLLGRTHVLDLRVFLPRDLPVCLEQLVRGRLQRRDVDAAVGRFDRVGRAHGRRPARWFRALWWGSAANRRPRSAGCWVGRRACLGR